VCGLVFDMMFFFRVALLSKYDEGRCLTHVDTEAIGIVHLLS